MIDVTDAPIDMSLRLWSDEVSLQPVLRALSLPCGTVHVRGNLVPPYKSARSRRAGRHYASTISTRGRDGEDIGKWMSDLLARLHVTPEVVELIRSHQVEATCWIAVLGRQPLITPAVDQALVKDINSLGVTVLVENYTQLDGGNPSRHWLPGAPASVRA